MIVPDLNLIVYAHDTRSPWHEPAKAWWQNALNGTEAVGLAPAVALGFVRLLSNPKVVLTPADPATLAAIVAAWFERPMVRTLGPGPRHWQTLQELLARSGGGSSLVTDAHLAALALDLGATLCSNDTDFLRFPGLKVFNPLNR